VRLPCAPNTYRGAARRRSASPGAASRLPQESWPPDDARPRRKLRRSPACHRRSSPRDDAARVHTGRPEYMYAHALVHSHTHTYTRARARIHTCRGRAEKERERWSFRQRRFSIHAFRSTMSRDAKTADITRERAHTQRERTPNYETPTESAFRNALARPSANEDSRGQRLPPPIARVRPSYISPLAPNPARGPSPALPRSVCYSARDFSFFLLVFLPFSSLFLPSSFSPTYLSFQMLKTSKVQAYSNPDRVKGD